MEDLLSQVTSRLNLMRRRVTSLAIPRSTYLVIWLKKDTMDIIELGKELKHYKDLDRERNMRNMLISWFERRAIEENKKFVAVELIAEKWLHPIISELWLKEDIVPYFVTPKDESEVTIERDFVKEVAGRFFGDDIIRVGLKSHNEVEVAELVTLDDYKNISDPDEFELLLKLAAKFKGKKIIFINATPQGGGVALMRHALIRLYRLLGVNAKWYVLQPLKEAFDITKTKFHNVLQAVADKDTYLTLEDKNLYDTWMAGNAAYLKEAYKNADVVVIDDPQPAGLIPYIRKENPKAKIIYRSHIQIVAELADKKDTSQANTWNFIWDRIKNNDLFVSHPIKAFVPASVPFSNTVMMPATTDALDGLNKPLTPRQMDFYLKLFDKILIENDQTPLDKKRPYVIQIARFDPSKGIPDVLESYRLLRNRMEKEGRTVPQLIICGHGSIDDPDGVPIYNYIMETLRSSKYVSFAKDIKVARLPASDQILNALLRDSRVALQLSHKEGFEVKVSEALMKGVPIIAYKAGGIPLQVKNGVSGYLVEVGDTKGVAEKMYKIFTDDVLYHKLKKGAIENVNPETSTVSNAINFLFLGLELLEKGKIVGNGKGVKELLYASSFAKS